MNNILKFPKVTTVFADSEKESNNYHFNEVIQNMLRKILPRNLLSVYNDDPDLIEDLKEEFYHLLPLVLSSNCESAPGTKSFFVLSRYRVNCFKFFFEMVSKWLIPGKRLNVVLIYAADFRMPEIHETDIFTICEVMVHIELQSELDEINKNLPIIESEIKLGMESAYYARKTLELKGLTNEEKTLDIQEHITLLVKRLPVHFDHDVFTEMQHVILTCPDEFKASRYCLHLSKIISIHYLFRKSLLRSIKLDAEKRYLHLKIFKSKIARTDGTKNVLSLIVGVNFLGNKEVFEERHLLKAVKNYISNVQSIENSFFSNKRGTENICTLYLEVEKNTGEDFSLAEIQMLRKELPYDLKDRIEHMMHPVFMPRNEEEIMRNILSLSSQIKYLRDEAQVFISFDEQTHTHVYFTVIIVRVVSPGSQSVQDLFKKEPTMLKYIHDRCKMVGLLRKKYAKEATVFRVKISSEQFLRADHSIDLNKARQKVVAELVKILGEFRDFNGGMITKQNELLCNLRELLKNSSKYNELLLENFFYSLNPVVMRSILKPCALKVLFEMLLEEIDRNLFNDNNFNINIQTSDEFVFVLLVAYERPLREEVTRVLHKTFPSQNALAHCFVQVYDIPCLGFIYNCDEPSKQQLFIQKIEQTLEQWEQKKQHKVEYVSKN